MPGPTCCAALRVPRYPCCRALLVVAEQNGNHLGDCWTEVLRCVSRFELLQQLTAGVPTDAMMFAMPDKTSAADKLKRRLMRRKGPEDEAHESFSSITDMGLHASELGGDSVGPGHGAGMWCEGVGALWHVGCWYRWPGTDVCLAWLSLLLVSLAGRRARCRRAVPTQVTCCRR